MIRKEKYHATRTARVTKIGCLIQLEYLHNNAAEMINAVITSKINRAYAILYSRK